MAFRTEEGQSVPAVTAAEMREVDRLAVEEFGLGILQMMENAGRSLAESVMDMLGPHTGAVVILAGTGGNGGGGLACARHLHNRGLAVHIAITRTPDADSAAGQQLRTLRTAGLSPLDPAEVPQALAGAALIVDALIGYGLEGSALGIAAHWIELGNASGRPILSLDVPSGLDATTGRASGPVVRPERTLTLALPKTGLRHVPDELFLADLGIPPEVYGRLGIRYRSPFSERFWMRLLTRP